MSKSLSSQSQRSFQPHRIDASSRSEKDPIALQLISERYRIIMPMADARPAVRPAAGNTSSPAAVEFPPLLASQQRRLFAGA